jgi:predicted rRNA methylase YqxC with S4 and FtsJ domains
MKILNLIKDGFKLLHERIKGIDVIRGVHKSDLGIALNRQPHHYSSSGNKYLENVLQNLNIQPTDNIIDLGCGKGGALITMAKFPFKEIYGVEYSEGLV